MPRQNRVTPYSELIATCEKMPLMGNRGCLHDDAGMIRKHHSREKRWIICLLDFKGRQRAINPPGQYTQLFFLDEATALAAGHRPCAWCQRERYNLFGAAWFRGNPDLAPSNRPMASQLDEALSADRLTTKGDKVTYQAPMEALPDGTFVALAGEAYLLYGPILLHWTPAGYDYSMTRPVGMAEVLTPRSIVAALAAGYLVDVHEHATVGPERSGSVRSLRKAGG